VKSVQKLNTVAASFLIKNVDVPMDVSTITIIFNDTRASEQRLLIFDMLSSLDEEKKNIQWEI
jgi:hypothetical protein